MFNRKKYLLVLVVTIIATVVQSKMVADAPPDLVMEKTTTKGVVGSLTSYLWPFTSVALQFINSILIHTKNMQLPCTIYNLSKLEYSCTPYHANVIDDSGAPMAR
ncbi:GSCOCG00007416001-RA-CDS [Cotesia congregata]|uniref:Uncharacterized protein n=1 Tax=Cotesia congregata TaxID=51543 RepID=A0A8J2MPZ2_COTCN|nr:GSCOCG00007416001-RA-CDS [Cotesia congregata]CAG5088662.1 Protein of unknown function [Cotesia congregata]